MIPGFSGHLVSEQFLEEQIAHSSQWQPVGQFVAALRRCREEQRLLGPTSTVRSILESAARPLVNVLGFPSIGDVDVRDDAAVATVRSDRVRIALLVTGWGERLEPWWRPAVVESGKRGASWCLLFNGTHLGVINASRVFSRRFAEFDLDCAADDDRSAAAMRLLATASALGSPGDSGELLSTDEIISLSERHSTQVCRSLRTGVLEASQHILRALVAQASTCQASDAFEQALTIIYRMLFLFFAEGRSLVPLWHPLYRHSYSLERLAEQATRTPVGLWDALRAVARLAHAGCRAGDLRVTPFNGRLFAPARTPLAEQRNLDDEAARQCLIALSTRPAADGEGRERIAYRDLGVEQLGAVYETLLDYVPHIEKAQAPGSRRGTAVVSLQAGSGVRKATGTFYTPQPIATYLVRQTLQPLVRDATPEGILSLKLLDPSMGSGAFLVAACAHLGEAYESALIAHGRCHPSDIGPRERAAIRRLIAERCLFGVDLNPMAVQLARLSIWLATLAADRPLSFLDHHLQVGDSLLGTWISCLRRPPTSRRHQSHDLPLFDDQSVTEAVRGVLPTRFSLACEPNDTPEQVRAKERSLAALTHRDSALAKWKRIADLWCARWFVRDLQSNAGLFATLSDAVLIGRCALPAASAGQFLQLSEQAAAARRFFHWELEFPEVFFDPNGQRRPDGGFDAIIGNPPWDMVRADNRNGEHRSQSREDAAAVIRFTRDAGVYEAQSDGHANRYQLFVERAVALARPGGRIGLVVPSGLVADQGSARLRRLLFSRCNLDAIVGFENKQAIFPIHRSVRFLVLSGTTGGPTATISCRFGEVDPAVLDTADGGGRPTSEVKLSLELLQRLSGNDLSIPGFRGLTDVAIAERAATLFAPLGSGWSARFGRELNLTDDRTSLEGVGSGLPVVEGKLIAPYRADLAGARFSISSREAQRLLGNRHQRWRLAYRDVASATNRLTLIAALLPPDSASTHTVFCLRTPLALKAQWFLCGLFNSFVVNYLVRLRVTTHVTTAIVERLPIPSEGEAGPAYDQIAAIARQLSRSDNSQPESRLNALVAKLYQLTDEEFAHVLETFPLIPRDHRERALHEFRQM